MHQGDHGEIAVSWREDAETIVFRLDGVPRELDQAVSGFWTPQAGGWEKPFPQQALGIEHVKQQLPRLIGPMLRNLATSQPPWEAALESIAARAEAAGLHWWLTGSGAAALRVPGIMPHDLDIMLDESQLDLAVSTFADVLVEPVFLTHGWVTRAFGVLFMGMRVDLAAGGELWVDHPDPVDFGPWAEAHLERVSWRGFEIRVPPLAVQAAVSRRRDRVERAELIEAVLARIEGADSA